MSGTSTWLHGQRKTELVDIAEKVGLKDYDGLKKAELETALDEHMRANQDHLSKDTSLAAYYKRVNSPVKRDSTSSTALVETKTPKRRVTKAKEDLEGEAPNASTSNPSTALARTPAAKAKALIPANVPLPPSPAQVATHIDRQAARVRSKLHEVYTRSGLTEYVDNIRDGVSSTASIESIAIVIELYGLINEILPKKTLFMVPAIHSLGLPEWPVKANDLFLLLTSDFWTAFGLWFLTSAFLPLGFAYFFNLTLKNKHGVVKHGKAAHPAAQYDPLTFNLSKALVMWITYSYNGSVLGWPADTTKARVEGAIPGGYQGLLIASGIGVITSLYEAVLRK